MRKSSPGLFLSLLLPIALGLPACAVKLNSPDLTADSALLAIDPARSEVVAFPGATAVPVIANNSAFAPVRIILRNAAGNGIPGIEISPSSNRADDAISPASAVTDSEGNADFKVRSKKAGTSNLSLAAAGEVFSGAAALEFVPGPLSLAASLVEVSQSSIVSGATTEIIITPRDEQGNLLLDSGLAVVPGHSGGASTGTFGAVSYSPSDGTYRAAFTGVLTGAATTIGADLGGAGAAGNGGSALPTVTVSPGAPAAAASLLASSAGKVNALANGADAFTTTVTLKDAAGNVVPGKTVRVISSRGVSDAISPASATTDAAGAAQFSVTSSAVGSLTLSAEEVSDSLTLATTLSLVFKPLIDTVTSTVALSSSSVYADGSTTSTVTVTLFDGLGAAIPGAAITLSSSRGGQDTITPLAASTDASGQLQITVSSGTAGSSVLTAASGAYTLASAPTLSFTAAPDPYFHQVMFLSNYVSGSINDVKGHTVTSFGNASLGAEGLFLDGNGDYLEINESGDDFSIHRGLDFTIEAIVKPQTLALPFYSSSFLATYSCSGDGVSGTAGWDFTGPSASGGASNMGFGAVSAGVGAASWIEGEESHIAVTRQGDTMRLFHRGLKVAETVWDGSSTMAKAFLRVGTANLPCAGRPSGSPDSSFRGWVKSARITQGVARYTSAFAPPTGAFPETGPAIPAHVSADPYWANVTLFADFEGTRSDAKGSTYITTYSPLLDMGGSQFGASSLSTGPYRRIEYSSPDLALGTGDFTVDFWVKFNNLSGVQHFDVVHDKTKWMIWTDYFSSQNLKLSLPVGTITSATPPVNQFIHLAFSRSAGVSQFYVNGVKQGEIADPTDYNIALIHIGGWESAPWDHLFGNIDNFRVTRGVARYTANFTPPTASEY